MTSGARAGTRALLIALAMGWGQRAVARPSAPPGAKQPASGASRQLETSTRERADRQEDPGDPLGSGSFTLKTAPAEPVNGFCDHAITLLPGVAQVFDMAIPAGTQAAFGRAGSYVENCPIETLGANTDILTNFGLFYSIVGDGTTFTASTCASQSVQDTILMVYAESDPTDPCAVLYCVTGNDNGCGTPNGPAEVSWCTVDGQGYVIVVHSAAFTEGSIIVTSSGAGCDTIADIAATMPSTIQSSLSGVPESETCAQGEMGLGINDGCGGTSATAQAAEFMLSGDIRVGTSTNMQIPIADRGPGPATDAQSPSLHDQEYYNIDITEAGILTVGGQVEFPFEVQVFQYSEIDPQMGLLGCEGLVNVLEGTFERETFGSIQALITEPGLYAVSVSHTDESPYIYECDDGEVDYAVAVDFTAFADIEVDESLLQIALQEPEGCGVNDPSDSNAGCAHAIPNAGPTLADGETVYGQVAVGTSAGATLLDIDQFSFTLANDSFVTFTVHAEMNWAATLYDNSSNVCGDILASPEQSWGRTSLSYALAAGDYSFLFTNRDFDVNFSCASGATEYAITLDVGPLPSYTPPAGDVVETEDYCAGIPYATVTTDANSGCDADTPGTVAGVIGVGKTAVGTVATTIAADGSSLRDVDTWELQVVEGTTYEVSIASGVPLGFSIRNENDCFNQLELWPDYNINLLRGGVYFVSNPSDAVGLGTTVEFDATITGRYSVTVFPVRFGTADAELVGCSPYSIQYDIAFHCEAFADITPTGRCIPGDCDGIINHSDFSCFLGLWANSNPFADITQSGSCVVGTGGDGIDLSDFSCYVAEWAGGVP